MYSKKRKKKCPFCQGIATKVYGDYVCKSCGAILNFNAINTDSVNVIFQIYQK
ncbi:MAG: hypothetical protein J7K40_13445 [candidate division Zixibacteria bacterium]|nr:hypothetical protein [candidate division Zixibacteria bacterium]